MFYRAVKNVQKSNKEKKYSRASTMGALPKIQMPKRRGTPQSSIFGPDTATSGSMSPSMLEELDQTLEDVCHGNDDDASEEEVVEKTQEEVQFERRVREELTESDERIINRKLREFLADDFKKIYSEAAEKQRAIKKMCRDQIHESRAILLEARMEAERETINRLQLRAVEEQTSILRMRKQRKKSEQDRETIEQVEEIKVSNDHAVELATLRKIQSNLDRARARRKNNIAAVQVDSRGKNNIEKKVKLVQHEIRRLEQAQEIHKIIVELHELGLQHHAKNLTHSLTNKETAEKSLRENLRQERDAAKIAAKERRNIEIRRLREERLNEKDKEKKMNEMQARMEAEKREKEKKEKILLALHRKARNREMQRQFAYSLFNTHITRAWSFSYFPPIKTENCNQEEESLDRKRSLKNASACHLKPPPTA